MSLKENERQGQSLTATQRRAIAALLQERDIRSAATMAKVAEATMYRWLRDDAFVAELRRAENELIDRVTRRMLHAQEGALAVTVNILADKTISPSVRLRAAGMILDNFVRLRELRNVEERLAAMEKALEGLRA